MIKVYDAHIYYDDLKTNFKNLKKLNEDKKFNYIISPQCTVESEPNKSGLMYHIQPYLLSNKFLYYFAMFISKSFYQKNKLRFFWKFFVGFKNYEKIIIPNNKDLLKKIIDYDFIKSWLWINPKEKDSIKDFNIFYDNPKVAGIKFHNYWHDLEPSDLYPFLEKNTYNKPVYIILKYQKISHILEMIIKFNKTNFVFGYGCFPHYKQIWKRINKFENVYIDVSSKHLNTKLIKEIFKFFNYKKIIFGSDYPYNFQKNNKFSYDLFINRFKLDKLTNEEKKLFYYNNLIKILDE